MSSLFAELNDKEILEVSGGAKEVSVIEALGGSVGTIIGFVVSYYVADPIINYVLGPFNKKL